MIRISGLSLSVHHDQQAMMKKIASKLHIKPAQLGKIEIVRRSIDARKKQDILYNYTLDVEVEGENQVLARLKKEKNIEQTKRTVYELPKMGEEKLKYRPVVVGFGPAGIFAALSLARKGYRPIVIERGEEVEARSKTVEEFWKSGKLNEESNVSFGEGGAGTFSDGKLNTLVKDHIGRNTFVMRTLVEFGADEEIIYDHKPHIGTDRLKEVIAGIRKEIVRCGGEVHFRTKLCDIKKENGKICGIEVECGKERAYWNTQVLILAIGHSARDTFFMLKERNLSMEAKAFAIGVRMQHPQEMIDISQYGEKEAKFLHPAPYKLTAKTSSGRGVYSFCMCPGGYVVNASTQKNRLAINGMSYHDRDSASANSAIIVTVGVEDFGFDGPLAGMYYQQELEQRAFLAANGKIPVQLYGDFQRGKVSKEYGQVKPCFCGQEEFAPVHQILPETVYQSIVEVMPEFDRKIKGFAREDAIVAGIESRTSSPVRIHRNEELQTNILGIYPCGEGAGYAGGITSAAMDGLKVAEAIIRKYHHMGR